MTYLQKAQILPKASIYPTSTNANKFKLHLLILYYFIDTMGGEQSSNKNINENELVELNISKQELERVQRSTHKPSPLYAKLANKSPATLRAVELAKEKLSNKDKKKPQSDGPGEALPLYQMVSSPNIYYKGEWLNGKQHGRGEVFTKSGIYFVGQFVQGTAECENGLVIFPDGSNYRGCFRDSSFEGKGVFSYEYNGTTYDGNWRNNKPQGEGKETYRDGSNYQGTFLNGKKHGRGVFKWVNGKVYEGEFEDGDMHGQGELFFPGKKSRFVGTFDGGEKAKGVLATEYGKYTGNFLNGLMHDSHGKFTWNDNKIYEGAFEYGQMHDRNGKLTLSNGEVVVGRWERGENVKIDNLSDNA